jgi:hypothetical protein
MKKVSKKLIAWLVGMISIIALYVLTIASGRDFAAISGIYTATTSTIAALTFSFMGVRTWKDYIRSKFYKATFDDKLSAEEKATIISKDCDELK